MRLTGKRALITGGASGIGKATARLFLEEGARVTIADFDHVTLQAALAELDGAGDAIHGVLGDVRSFADAATMVQSALERFGRLDILVCCAGIISVQPISQLTQEEWDRVIGTNLTGTFTMIRHTVPVMQAQGGGVIITIGSDMGIVGVPDAPAYNASKGGVVLFTRAIALDLIKDNIRVNCLCPGITRTALLEHEADLSPDPAQRRRDWDTVAPIGRVADPREIAYGALFLASAESSFAVGSALLLDGGYTAR
jgi:NAD(P)-dependent dehydrogenase (short-subunit alcohol dehydrogenase family)